MPRIAITDEDLDDRSPSVYRPVGGSAAPDVYGPADDDSERGSRTRPPKWAAVAGAAGLIILGGLGGYLVGGSGAVDADELQRRLDVQRLELQAERRSAERQAASAAKEEAERGFRERLVSERRAARAEGRRAGEEAGYQRGLQAGRAEGASCTGLLC